MISNEEHSEADSHWEVVNVQNGLVERWTFGGKYHRPERYVQDAQWERRRDDCRVLSVGLGHLTNRKRGQKVEGVSSLSNSIVSGR